MVKKVIKITLLIIGIPVILIAGNFLLAHKLDADINKEKNFYPVADKLSAPMLLPSVFINGERFYIKLPGSANDTLLGFGDTGGGICMLMPAIIDRLNLQSKVKEALLKGIMPAKYVLFYDIVSDKNFPSPVILKDRILRTPFSMVSEPFLLVPPKDDELKSLTSTMNLDAFLGQNFFMGKAWTIDYIHKQIWVNTPLTANDEGKPGVQKIGFKKNSNNENIYGHASMVIEVNGELIDVLFDTGATIVLSDDGKKAFNTNEKTIGGSFIAASIFDKWRKEHPEWKYYPKADLTRDVIEVPLVKIGGCEVGSVLFARRPDEVWSQGMISSMDKVVKGAIGGSALKYLKVTIDYNSELIKFEK